MAKKERLIPMPTSREFWLKKRESLVKEQTPSGAPKSEVLPQIKRAESIVAQRIKRVEVGIHDSGSRMVWDYIPVSTLGLTETELPILVDRLDSKGWVVGLQGETGWPIEGNEKPKSLSITSWEDNTLQKKGARGYTKGKGRR